MVVRLSEEQRQLMRVKAQQQHIRLRKEVKRDTNKEKTQ